MIPSVRNVLKLVWSRVTSPRGGSYTAVFLTVLVLYGVICTVQLFAAGSMGHRL